MDCPNETHCPSSHVGCSSPSITARRNSRSRRDLPMPASPATDTTWPWPRLTSAKRSSSVPSSRAAPDERREPALGARRRVGCARPRARSDLERVHRRACPFTASSPRSRVSKKPATSRYGSPRSPARCRAAPSAAGARPGWSCRPPPCSPSGGRRRSCPTTTGPVLRPMRICRSMPRWRCELADRSRRSARWIAERGVHGARGPSSCAIGAPKSAITPSPVYWLIVPSKRWTSAVISSKQRSMIAVHSSGSSLSASAVKPAMSAKRTVTCRRSPSRADRERRILSARCRGV